MRPRKPFKPIQQLLTLNTNQQAIKRFAARLQSKHHFDADASDSSGNLDGQLVMVG